MKNQMMRSRRPDHVRHELINVLASLRTFSFNELFLEIYENLKKRNAVSGGEEMLRLRTYEKLQQLVKMKLVKKIERRYTAVSGIDKADL